VFVITRLVRAAPYLRELIGLADTLKGCGIDLIVLRQGIATTTPTGRLVLHMIGAIDELTRELIVEGAHEGLAGARARRAVIAPGRPPWRLQVAQARRCTTNAARTVSAATPCSRSPRPSASPAPPSTGTWTQPRPPELTIGQNNQAPGPVPRRPKSAAPRTGRRTVVECAVAALVNVG
jgi:resolvase-like protein